MKKLLVCFIFISSILIAQEEGQGLIVDDLKKQNEELNKIIESNNKIIEKAMLSTNEIQNTIPKTTALNNYYIGLAYSKLNSVSINRLDD